MQAVLLAAGPGTRMRPLTHDRPKNLLSVAGRPIVHHLLEDLKAAGVTDVVLVVGHGHERVQRYLGDGKQFGLSITYAVQEERLGLGHALWCARSHVDGDFILLAADAWYHPDLLARLAATPAPALIQVQDGRSLRHGVPVIEASKAAGIRLVERGGAENPSGAAYKVPHRVLQALTPDDARLVEALDRDMRQNGPWNVVHAEAHEYIDIQEPEDLLEVHERLMADLPQADQTWPKDVHAEGAVEVGEGTLLRPGTVLLGPVTIGKNCDIGPHAVIGPGTAIRNQARVGPFTFLERCTIASNVTIGAQCRVHGAIVENGASLGHGARVDGGKGAIIGPDAVLEDEAHVTAGGRIGKGARVAAGRTVAIVPDGGVAV